MQRNMQLYHWSQTLSVTLTELSNAIGTYRINSNYATQIENYRDAWHEEVERLFHLDNRPTTKPK